jgi:hypothetical protein
VIETGCTVADDTADKGPTLVERWLQDQQAWQQTTSSYLDAMVKNDDFLVHLGNALRGSLLAGKAYPTQPPSDAAEPASPADDRLDQVLFALHQLQGQVEDLRMSLEDLRGARPSPTPAVPPKPRTKPAKQVARATLPLSVPTARPKRGGKR